MIFATEAAFRSILLLSICSENFNVPVVCPAIDSQPHCAPKFSFVVLYWAALDAVWFYICPLPGAACSSASRCWKNVLTYGVPTSPKLHPGPAT
jgi:hypothetical protein